MHVLYLGEGDGGFAYATNTCHLSAPWAPSFLSIAQYTFREQIRQSQSPVWIGTYQDLLDEYLQDQGAEDQPGFQSIEELANFWAEAEPYLDPSSVTIMAHDSTPFI